MLSDKRFTYYQPQAYHDDGTNIDYGALPEELFSFQAFPTKEMCEEWLRNHNYDPRDFCIFEYSDDDIEDVTLIDQNGDIIPRIEEVPEDRIVNMLADEVLFNAGTGSLDNVVILKQDDETQQEYEDRVYQKALDAVNDEIVYIEENGKYNFQSYCGTPDVEWYDKARLLAVKNVLRWMSPEPEE